LKVDHHEKGKDHLKSGKGKEIKRDWRKGQEIGRDRRKEGRKFKERRKKRARCKKPKSSSRRKGENRGKETWEAFNLT
jgi:hypothetical protein